MVLGQKTTVEVHPIRESKRIDIRAGTFFAGATSWGHVSMVNGAERQRGIDRSPEAMLAPGPKRRATKTRVSFSNMTEMRDEPSEIPPMARHAWPITAEPKPTQRLRRKLLPPS